MVFAIVGAVAVELMHGYLDRRLDEQLKTSQVAQVPGLRNSHGNPEVVCSWYSAVFEVDGGVATPQPDLLSDVKPLADVAADATRGDVFRTVYLHGDGPYRVHACSVATDSGGTGAVLLSAAPRADLDGLVRQLVPLEVIAFLISLAVLVVAGRLVLRRGLQPLSALAGMACDIASHDLTVTADLPVRPRARAAVPRSMSCGPRSP